MSAIQSEASPNAFTVINSPLPRLIVISIPCGEWIYEKHEQILFYLTVENFGEFLIKDKQETLHKNMSVGTVYIVPTQM